MSLRALVALPLLLAACGLRPYDFGASATATSTNDNTTTAATAPPVTDSSTASDPTTGSASTGTTATSGDPTLGGDTTRAFIIFPDIGNNTKHCDQWVQDCPDGQKCMPYSGDGDNSWESLKCVDIVPDPDAVDEPCMVFGSGVSGEDTCDKGLLCWDVTDGLGTCVAMCIGSPDMPHCVDPTSYCTIAGDGVLTFCLPFCDPLLQDCSGDDLCVPHPWVPQGWLCVHDASDDDGQAFDTCEYVNACDKGVLCLDPAGAVECDPMASGCCLPLCDLSLPNTCPGAGQECLPWYEPGQAPPGFEDVGTCDLPMP